MWDEILWLRQCVTVSQSSCSCILQTRFKMLLAISQMQVRGGVPVPLLPRRVTFGGAPLGAAHRCAGAGKTPSSARSVPPGCSWASRSPRLAITGGSPGARFCSTGSVWGLSVGALPGGPVSSRQRGVP